MYPSNDTTTQVENITIQSKHLFHSKINGKTSCLKHSHNTNKIITSCKTSNKRYTDLFAECYIWHCDHAIIHTVYKYTSNFLLICTTLYSQLFTRELSVHVCKGNAVGQFCTIVAIGKF